MSDGYENMWTKRHGDDCWTKEFTAFEAVATISIAEPHEAVISFPPAHDPFFVDIGSFARWDDAAKMIEQYISALLLEEELV